MANVFTPHAIIEPLLDSATIPLTCVSFAQFLIVLCSLTSTVHKFPDVGRGHDLVGAEIVGKLATDGNNDGHNQMGKCGQYAHLEEREKRGKRLP